MAARTQPKKGRHRLIAACAMVGFALVGLSDPTAASAHSGTVVNALDFRARVTSTGRSGLIAASILDGDRKLALTVAPTATVVVLGYQGEPLLRFSPAGVELNERSPSAIADRLARRNAVPALDPRATPDWKHVSKSHHFAWHDHRLGPTPGRAYPAGNVGRWTIPLLVRGKPDAISGRLLHDAGPALWPWLVLLAATACVAVAFARVRRRRNLVESAAYLGAAIGGVAAAVLSVSFSLVPGRSALDAWTTVVFCIVGIVVVLVLFHHSKASRHALAGFVGLLALFVGLSDAAVLVHGFVIASLPAPLVRTAVAVACSTGAVAATCAAVLVLEHDRTRTGRPRIRRPRMAIPRGRM